MVAINASDRRISVFQNAFCGSVSGILTRTLTAPLDTAKILAQVGTQNSRGFFVNTLLHLMHSEGWKSMWKGNLTSCVRIFPYSIIQFSTFYQMKHLMSDDLGRMTSSRALVAGAVTGMTATVLTHPLDTVKTRLIVQPFDKNKSAYSGIWNALVTIRRQEGLRTLFSGLTPALTATVPYSITMFLAIQFLDVIMPRARFLQTPVETLAHGSIAAAVALTVTHPFDTVRRKLQARSTILPDKGGVDIHFTGARNCAVAIVSNHGLKGLWRGFIPALFRVVPYNVLMFVTYEASKRGCLFYNGYSHHPIKAQSRSHVDQHYKDEDMDDLEYYGKHEDPHIFEDEDDENTY